MLYDIVHSFTNEFLDKIEATCPVDALAAYSMRQGFADPRETAVNLTERVPPTGATEGDFFYLRPGRVLGMVFTNFSVHAEPVRIDLPYGVRG